ncbi:uncharacterized protein LOC119367052 [Triticum dicoccoides]|uniref:uncharacterized protein LOC119367052 n=1 Tax=Triticum dicoccoides TaxID=85692 RepID=UPI001890917D|nr:uncharacterized protein LOC119367052 [Triticum dicoccoides]XP_044327127.1 uncharacterized protein LOC123047597 [Triticum aestivum]
MERYLIPQYSLGLSSPLHSLNLSRSRSPLPSPGASAARVDELLPQPCDSDHRPPHLLHASAVAARRRSPLVLQQPRLEEDDRYMAKDAQVRGAAPMVAASSTGISAGWGCRRGAARGSGLRRAGCGATDDDGRRDSLIRALVLNPVPFRPDPRRCSSPARWPVTRGPTAAQDHGRSSSHARSCWLRLPVAYAGVAGVQHHGASSRARKQTVTITLRPAGAPSPRSMVVVNAVGSNAAAVGSIPYRALLK